ncbi:hypothetical protein [Brevibacterium luteolum]|uniref:Uncharacterized protein n=1 Tax=Brevibacterium luteolum TaxID=199591 RepID=A0A6G8KZ37_9MICO|nr:hypothetical protein [Brevibacterium luteolum]QIN29770.1 hypothetical protein EW640_11160 [Brevibacterium luteolum]
MQARPSVVNKIVFAVVEPVDNRERFALEHGLADVGWAFERDGESYIVALPLYCARPVALAEARNELASFSRSYARLSVRELRLGEAELPPSRLAWVSKKHSFALLERYNDDPEISLGREPWEFCVLRSTDHARFTSSRDAKRAAREEAHFTAAVSKLTARTSRLPGTPFDPSGQKISTATAPALVVANPRKQRAKTVAWALFLTVVLLAIATFSKLTWSHIFDSSRPLISRRGAGILGWGTATIVSCAWIALKFTIDRRNRVVRSIAALTAIALGFYVGLALNFAQVDAAKLALTLALLAGGVFIFLGWTHLLVRMPTSRAVLSISAIALATALGTSTAPLLIAVVFDGMGLPLTAQQAPAGITLIASATVFCILATIAALFGAFVGWLKYFSVSTSSLTQAINVVVAGLVVFATLTTVAFGLTFLAHDRGQIWRGEIAAGSVPGPLSIFMSRACLMRVPDTATPVPAPTPTIVINASDGSTLLWDLSPDESADANKASGGENTTNPALEPFEKSRHSLRPLDDGVLVCGR